MEEPKREDFGKKFHWGVSTAAYQIEGFKDSDGKGPSIWDNFTHRKGKIYQDQNADIACEFYYRYSQDLRLLNRLGFNNFRFSLSWSRIFPQGTKTVNSKGLDFYNRVIDNCLQQGIQPWITLYHWDLPLALQDQGGWTNREILNWFEGFVSCCARNFGDRVTNWMVLNEPMVFVGAGHFLGVHAPGLKGMRNFLPSIHHAALCQSLGGRILRSELSSGRIGTTFSCSYVEPATNREKDINATSRMNALLNRLFLEPALGMGYPVDELPVLRRLENYAKADDCHNLKFDFDFIGIQNYTREVVKHSLWVPYLRANLIQAAKRKVPSSAMGWEIYPDSIYHILKQFAQYSIPSIIVTENGLALNDSNSNGAVNDPIRIRYIKDVLQNLRKAQLEGVPLDGYFYWTFLDNFEWAEGYYPRFGLVYNHHLKQRRVIKDSGYWWQEFLTRPS